jgi:ribonuclease HI
MAEIIGTARATGSFFMEALWTKFLPVYQAAMDWIRSGKIGTPRAVQAAFCFSSPNVPVYRDSGYATDRLFDLALAGGAALDVGIYPVTFALDAARAAFSGGDIYPDRIMSFSRLGKTGVDVYNSVSLLFADPSGKDENLLSAQLSSAIDLEYPLLQNASVYGSDGTLVLPKFWYAQRAEIHNTAGAVVEVCEKPFKVNGYEYEIAEFTRCFLINTRNKSVVESPVHTHAQTMAAIRLLDTIRLQGNVFYPGESMDLLSQLVNNPGILKDIAAEAQKSTVPPRRKTMSPQKVTLLVNPGAEPQANETPPEVPAPVPSKDGIQRTGMVRRAARPAVPELTVFTDGGCAGNPGPGGWGVVILFDKMEYQFSGGENPTTNNRMELMAAIEALKKLAENPAWSKSLIKIYCDSQYVKNGITDWINTWKRNGWRTSEKKEVKNRDLWLELDALARQFDLDWQWVKGHAGNRYNELCDTLAAKEWNKFLQ